MAERSRTIGQLNGWWSFLLKTSLALFPVFLLTLIGWSTWVTRELLVIRAEKQHLVTKLELAEFKAHMYERFAQLPPPDTRAEIKALKIAVDNLETNQTKILTILERLEK